MRDFDEPYQGFGRQCFSSYCFKYDYDTVPSGLFGIGYGLLHVHISLYNQLNEPNGS